MANLVIFLIGVIFVELFIFLNILLDAKYIIDISKQAVSILAASEMSDEEKESRVKSFSFQIFKATTNFIGKFLLIGLVLYACYFLVSIISEPLFLDMKESLKSVRILLIVTIITMIYIWVRNVIRSKL